ncbi:transmembrane protein 43 homolog [Chelonus insularis]|uniref:transmembrane protein 43 homolog n=1 Tax=Chelonus insularis TaxID=460826 RepID=UPI00158E5FFA|nr:transmembrane protein 43 homolog [Chelonus insularis]
MRRENSSTNNESNQEFQQSRFTTVIGCILCLIGIFLLVSNEGEAASVSHSLNEALSHIVIIENIYDLSKDYEDRLVYFSGPLWINEPLTEPDYGVIIESVKLKRRVQVYQWVEIEEERTYENYEDGKHYYYTTEWKDKLIDSDQFYIRYGHENPKEMPIKSQIQIADQVKIGNIILGSELKKKFNDFREITSDQRPERSDIKMHAGLYYHSSDLWNTQVGDVRVLLSFAGKAGDIYTIVGKFVRGTIVPFITPHGNEILLQRKNKVTIEIMFHLEHVYNYWRTWIMRCIGWLVIFMSTTCLSNTIKKITLNSQYLSGIIPLDSLALTTSFSISILVVGIGWLWYRPIIAICITLLSTFPFLYYAFFSSPNQTRERYHRIT